MWIPFVDLSRDADESPSRRKHIYVIVAVFFTCNRILSSASKDMTIVVNWFDNKLAEEHQSTDFMADIEKHTRLWKTGDINIGEILGEGTFASVFVVRPQSSSEKVNHHCFPSNSAWFCRESCTSDFSTSSREITLLNFTPTCKYALKKLNVEVLEDPVAREHAIDGIKLEAEILSNLPPHPNIISLEGLSESFFKDPASGFLILELLHETLKEQLDRWRNHSYLSQKRRGWVEKARRFLDKSDYYEQRARLAHVGPSIASAMAFLHQHHIAFRNLKPSNVGFTLDGAVRLFDFGLARHVNEGESHLTPYVGTFRYMSPECMTGREYGFESDVYSFSIMLWEVITLENAYKYARTPQQLRHTTHACKGRPNLWKVVSNDMRFLLRACWNPNASLRPTFATIHEALRCQMKPDVV
jgi:serine/threonine protein kinase